eukprot:jgi/Chlat1/8379/Chrsp80S00643
MDEKEVRRLTVAQLRGFLTERSLPYATGKLKEYYVEKVMDYLQENPRDDLVMRPNSPPMTRTRRATRNSEPFKSPPPKTPQRFREPVAPATIAAPQRPQGSSFVSSTATPVTLKVPMVSFASGTKPAASSPIAAPQPSSSRVVSGQTATATSEKPSPARNVIHRRRVVSPSPTRSAVPSSPSAAQTQPKRLSIENIDKWLRHLPTMQHGLKLALFTVLALIALLSIYLFLASAAPFCDTGKLSTADATCVPCPQHGVCSGGRLKCKSGYRHDGWQCVLDEKAESLSQRLVGPIVHHVCTSHAKHMCGEQGAEWVSEPDVRSAVLKPYIAERADADTVLAAAVQKASAVLDMQAGNDTGKSCFRCPPPMAWEYRPLSCRLAQGLQALKSGAKHAGSSTLHSLLALLVSLLQGVRDWLLARLKYILCLLLLVSLAAYVVFAYKQRRRTRSAAHALATEALAFLESAKRDQSAPHAYTVVEHLRDSLLELDEPHEKEKKIQYLWPAVVRIVRKDSRVHEYKEQIKGEPRTVWEWQAASTTPVRRTRQTQSPGAVG